MFSQPFTLTGARKLQHSLCRWADISLCMCILLNVFICLFLKNHVEGTTDQHFYQAANTKCSLKGDAIKGLNSFFMFFVKGNCRITASLKSREKGESGIEICQIKTLNLLEICFPGFLPQSSYGLRECPSQWHVCQWWALVGEEKKRLVI